MAEGTEKEVIETEEIEKEITEEVIEQEDVSNDEVTEGETVEENAPIDDESEEEVQEKDDTPKNDIIEKKEDENLILGQFKTKDELDAYIQEQINEKKSDIDEEQTIIKKEQEYLQSVQSISGQVSEIEQAKEQLKYFLDQGRITIDQYAQALEKAKELEFAQLIEYQKLEANKMDVIRPKVKRENTIYYSKLEETIPELKDEIVSKHAKKLKEELFDNACVSIQQDFEYYLKDYILPLAKEAETKGYERALRELDTKKLKAQQKSIAAKENPKPKDVDKQTEFLNYIIN